MSFNDNNLSNQAKYADALRVDFALHNLLLRPGNENDGGLRQRLLTEFSLQGSNARRVWPPPDRRPKPLAVPASRPRNSAGPRSPIRCAQALLRPREQPRLRS
ncbi:hypothetical protein [Novosphingobium beihaiensis]|uniref:Uncharacterized protein n=1 Tax=Novosphingobium beihaiensis TaxID=2930389 RepID=A0ABT0BQP0_9SPHN|nr:hypothetical protein [Novosphingobium beihaiensis]MCJ2187275.1 hypothetical protein [Novosphingobium beihaiensis]